MSLRNIFAKNFKALDKLNISGRGTVFIMDLSPKEKKFISQNLGTEKVIKINYDKTYLAKITGLEQSSSNSKKVGLRVKLV